MVRARPLVVGCSAGTLVLGVISIFFILTAYTTYRSEDFVQATKHRDFAVLGTCVESVTDDIVSKMGIKSDSWSCSGSKEKLARVLLSQTHSIYYLHKTAPSDEVTNVAFALMASTLGSASLSINASIAANVLSMLDDKDFVVPKSCASIYTGATSTPYDTVGTGTTPLLPEISCSAELAGTNPSSFTSTEWGRLLYACEKQFHFGRSGPHPDTYGIPLMNEPPGPNFYPWPNTTGFNETSAWSVKSRMFLGLRFGWSLWAYTPNILALAYLTMDAALVLLTETTIKNRADGMKKVENDTKQKYRNAILHMTATYIRERGVRFIFASLLVINSILWMTIAVWSPWGLFAPRLGRPYCDEGADADVDPSFSYIFYKKTQGGWKSDAPTLFLEFAVICAQVFILFALPLARRVRNKNRGGSSDAVVSESLEQYGGAKTRFQGWVAVVQSAKGGGFFIVSTIIGIVLLIIGNAVAGSVFGNAWARAVADESVPWNEVVIAEYIYDMNLGTLVSILAGGLVLGVVIGRWMIDSFTCESLNIFLVWAVFAGGAFTPMFVVFGLNYFTDKDNHVADCGLFPDDGNYDMERNSCEARYWTVIVGTIILGLVVLILTIFGLAEARYGIINRPNRSKIHEGAWNADSSELGDYSGLGQQARASADPYGRFTMVVDGANNTGGRYQSKDEGFFNFSGHAKRKDDSTQGLLSSSPQACVTGALPASQPAQMRFTLNPATIVPANTRR